jgi:hypothetical protein
VKFPFGISCTACLFLATLSEARAQSMIDWARGRGLAGAEAFDDSIVVPGEFLRPWIDRERGLALLGVGVGRERWQSSAAHQLENDLRFDGELALAVDNYEPIVGMWGRSSRVNFRFSLGGASGGAQSELSGELSTGALLTLDNHGSGAVARISGAGSVLLEPGSTALLTNVGVPLGFTFNKVKWYGELLVWPSLGWASVTLDRVNRSSGPLFFGAIARFGMRTTWFEANHLRSAVEADVDSTRMSVCTQFEPVTICTDGWWLHVHDILDERVAGYTRVGLRIGVGSSVWRTTESLVRAFH